MFNVVGLQRDCTILHYRDFRQERLPFVQSTGSSELVLRGSKSVGGGISIRRKTECPCMPGGGETVTGHLHREGEGI